MTALPYFLTASLYLLLFYSCYWLLLRRNTFFGLNRAYLLVAVLLSLLLPLVQLPTETTEPLPIGTMTLPTFTAITAEHTEWSLTEWFWALYGIGAASLLVRLGLNLETVFRLIRRGTLVRTSAYTLVKLPDDSTPSFSFGPYLVLNHTDALAAPDVLLRHEEAHIRQHHTADILLLELVQIAFWFNPVIWFYKRALQEVHEFLADRAVTHLTLQPNYAQQLVAYALDVPSAALTTPYVSKSTLKQRIVMLQKPQTHRRALLGYALVLPLAALLTMCTQSERDQPQSAAARAASPAREGIKVEGKVYDQVEDSPQFPGGMPGLIKYLSENLKYPEAARKAKVEGTVMVRFVLTKDGDITNVQILKGIGYGADAEAVRVVQQMPRWKPAKQDGKAVNVQYHLPINYQLEESSKKAVDVSQLSHPEHFVVDDKEVSQQVFLDRSKSEKHWKVVRADADSQTIYITTKAG